MRFYRQTLESFLDMEFSSTVALDGHPFTRETMNRVREEWAQFMLHSHVFHVPRNLSKLFAMTDNTLDGQRLPFQVCFIETGGLETPTGPIDGICVGQEGETLLANCFGPQESDKDGRKMLSFIHVVKRLPPDYRRQEDLSTARIIDNFVLSFMDALEHKQVEASESHISRKNTEWFQSRRVGNPRSFIVIPNKELKDDLSRLSKGLNRYSYRFWVRGHWRSFRSSRYSESKRGGKTWIRPYVKGEGLLVKKAYVLPGEL